MQKSHQANAPRQRKWTDNYTTEKKGEVLTGVAVAQPLQKTKD